MVNEFLSVDPYRQKLSPADYKRCATMRNVYEGVAVQCGMYDGMEFEATKAYVTENGNFTIVPVSIYNVHTSCIQRVYIVHYITVLDALHHIKLHMYMGK